MKQLIRHGFNRRQVLLPMMLTVVLVIAAFILAETRRFDSRDMAMRTNEQQVFLTDLTELVSACYQAESSQRGYILTGFEGYLAPYNTATRTAREKITALGMGANALTPEEAQHLELIRERIAGKLSEMDTTIEMRRMGRLPAAMSLMNTDIGLSYMREIQESVDWLRESRQRAVGAAQVRWQGSVLANSLINALMTLFTIGIILLVGLLASREIDRRIYLSNELERQVSERTNELQELSEQLLRISETEKSSLSRELHDELGGLLVSMKMEVVNLKRKTSPAPEHLPLWNRLESSVDAGVDLKRRVIENLRPTLLDNLGLLSALRWQAEETCRQAGIELELTAPEGELEVEPEAGIALFRVVQETFTNIAKHARATKVRMIIDPQVAGSVTIGIHDNGVGITQESLRKSGSHGLRQMEFRMTAIGGEVSVRPGQDGGTTTIIRYRPVR